MHLNDYEVEKGVAFSAQYNLKKGNVVLFAVSGKMGSGKDTVGDLLLERLNDKYPHFIDLSFGKLIRDEIDYIQSNYRRFNSNEIGTELKVLSDEINADLMDIKQLTQIIKDDNVYERSGRARNALQFWGDIRRNEDVDYWIKSLGREITRYLANGYSVNVTDIRFPGEVKLIESFHKGKVIRLDVSEEIRLERMKERDGFEANPESLTHRTEIVLDKYKFEKVFNNEKDINLVIDEIIEYLIKDDEVGKGK